MQVYTTVMAKKYSIADARKHLPTLVSEAESGAGIELTRRGKPVAALVSIHEYHRIKGKQRSFAEAYADFVSRFDLAAVGLDADDLRDRTPGRPVDV